MILNGVLGGLVGITASADLTRIIDAFVVGLISGLLIVFSVSALDRLKLYDPVGAISVHLTCGVWGTLAVGLFGQLVEWQQFLNQLIGIGAVGIFCVLSSFLILFILKKTAGIRVTEQEGIEGLDAHEHGSSAYSQLQYEI